MKSRTVLGFFIVLVFVCSCSETQDVFYERFKNPPVESQPFVRWWWNGNCVEGKEILRELDVMKAAGIGGVEINPIAMPWEVKKPDTECLIWGSPEWSRMVKLATDGVRDRGMIADIIIGTGWPFGGKFLEPEEQIKAVVVNNILVEGPLNFKGKFEELAKMLKWGRVYKPDEKDNPPKPRLHFMRLVPENIERIEQVIDVTEFCNVDGQISMNIPEGKFTLVIGSFHTGTGFRKVTQGAPGADGPCLDHYNAAAVIKYCDRLANALEPVFGGPLGKNLRALFVDSIELSGSNWSNDFIEEFRKRKGYDLTPYFPFIFNVNAQKGYQKEWTTDPELKDTIMRVRYDYNRTLVDVFLERFTRTFHRWSHEHGMKSRYQAYGTPWLMGMAEGYMIPDIPESNNWLFSPDAYTHGYNVWNKYTSSGGHLMGRKIISSEAMTNTRSVFKTTLEMIKGADDLNFIMGINHSVLHGFNYSPPEAGFPGWVRFGTYFSEHNTWWQYLKLWTDYNARLSTVFQTSHPVVEYAVLAPTADIWSTAGLVRVPFHLNPWYCHRLWESIHQNGCSADYISENVIQGANFKGGTLNYGNMRYKVLILCDVRTIQPGSAEAISEFAKMGGRVVFVNSWPERSPSLLNSKENDRIVKNTIKGLLRTHPNNVINIPGPKDQQQMITWTKEMIKKIDIKPDVHISTLNPSLYQIHNQFDKKDIFFFVNSDNEKSVSFEAEFQTGDKIPWQWDPTTGERTVYSYKTIGNQLSIELEPLESLLLVFEPGLKGASKQIIKTDRSSFDEIKTDWTCIFQHVENNSFSRTFDRLIDLRDSSDKMLQTFAGTIIYTAEFESNNSKNVMLDLGKVYDVSEITLNGKRLGVRWWGNHTYDVSGVIQNGKNKIEIKVTTVLFNYMKSLNNNRTARKWTYTNETVSTGLVGPIRLYSVKRM